MRVWADIGIASFEGGFGFDAIIYIVPKFHFEVDIDVHAGIHVFGIDFASVNIDGSFAGPGRWHIVGNAEVHTPWPLPDFCFHVDETFGEDERDAGAQDPARRPSCKKELEKVGNWSAQLPQGGDAFATFAKLPDDAPACSRIRTRCCSSCRSGCRWPRSSTSSATDSIDGEAEIAIDQISFGSIAEDRRQEARRQLLGGAVPRALGRRHLRQAVVRSLRGRLRGRPARLPVRRDRLAICTTTRRSTCRRRRRPRCSSFAALTAVGARRLGEVASAPPAARPAPADASCSRRSNARSPSIRRRCRRSISAPARCRARRSAGNAAHSYWSAVDHVAASGAKLQVVEAFETVQAF